MIMYVMSNINIYDLRVVERNNEKEGANTAKNRVDKPKVGTEWR